MYTNLIYQNIYL